MNVSCDELQQWTALEAVGALEGVDAVRLRQRLESDPAARDELKRFLDVAGAVGALVQPRRPSAGLRKRVLDQIANRPQVRGGEATVPGTGTHPAGLAEGFRLTRHDAPWMPAPLPGMRFKVVSAGPQQEYVMLEVELAAGAHYPEHDHLGPEDLYVLTGDLQTEGMRLGPGDVFHAESGTHHEGLRSEGGCTALLIVSRAAFAEMQPA